MLDRSSPGAGLEIPDLKQWILSLLFFNLCSLMALLRTAWALQALACCSQLGLSYTWPRFMFCQKSTAEGIGAPHASTMEPSSSSRAVWASPRAWLSSWGLDFLCWWPSDCQMIKTAKHDWWREIFIRLYFHQDLRMLFQFYVLSWLVLWNSPHFLFNY